MTLTEIDKFENSHIGSKLDWVYGTSTEVPIYAVLLDEDWAKFSTNHSRVNGVYRSGGPFFSKKEGYSRTPSGVQTIWRPGGKLPAYQGSVVATYPPAPQPVWDGVGLDPASEKGADAWAHARKRLTAPDFNVLQPIYELRDLPKTYKGLTLDIIKKMRKARRLNPKLKNVSDYHLAQQFGWQPMWRDISKFLKAHRTSQGRVKQLIRDEGRLKRVSGKLHNRKTVTETYLDNGAALSHPVLVSSCYKRNGYGFDRHTSIDKSWYVGSFSYILPPGPKDVEYRRKLRKALYGNTDITPKVAYDLIPWSWLVDWFVDFGDFFEATSKGVEDRLYAHYFYVMRHVENRTDRFLNLEVYTSKDGRDSEWINCKTTRRYAWKGRAISHPMGWGFNDEDLSPYQMSILGALATSKGSK